VGYSKEHVERTRFRILEQAGTLFRRFGYSGVGIDKIMNAADLTRGGFYAHFKSKAHLFQNVVGAQFNFSKQLETLKSNPPDEVGNRVLFAIRHYLAADKRDHIGAACTMAASAVDVAGAEKKTKAEFEKRLDELLAELKALAKEDGVALEDKRASAVLALSVGGLVLARACNDEYAADLLDSCYAEVERSIGQTDNVQSD